MLARQAQAGEWIHTHTSDGLETANAAEAGDFIVRNQTAAGEEYIVPAHKFKEKYSWLSAVDELWHEYLPLGRIIAVELTPERLQRLGLPEQFEFQAPWEDPMTAKSGDFMGGPEDFSEVYRLARKEFFETYAPLAGA
ncbi:MAG: hypothetical protein JNK89_09810 [Saprospiraceae bacterium]|nr:hypothetical protein [Saprospiraceae bacterium]